MTIAERYIERGKLVAARQLIAAGVDRSFILKTLKLSEQQLDELDVLTA